jgi:hypothetical protein
LHRPQRTVARFVPRRTCLHSKCRLYEPRVLRTGPKRFAYSAAVGCFFLLLLLDFFIAAPRYVEVDCLWINF